MEFNKKIIMNIILASAFIMFTVSTSNAENMEVDEMAPYSVNDYGDQGVLENNAYTSPAAGVTGSPVGAVTYSLSGVDAGNFTIDPATGVVSMVARDYENPLDADGNNLYSVIVTGTDADSNTATRELDVVVFNDCSGADGPSVFKLSAPDSLGDTMGDEATLQLRLLGPGGTPIQGVAVIFSRTSGNATITTPSGNSGADGLFTSQITGNSIGVSMFTAMYDSSGDGTPDTTVTLGSPTAIQFTSDVSSFAIRGMVGIGTEDPHPSSVLEVAGTEKGVLIPRIGLISTTDTETIENPAVSLLIYNTNAAAMDVGFVFWNGTEWQNVCTR